MWSNANCGKERNTQRAERGQSLFTRTGSDYLLQSEKAWWLRLRDYGTGVIKESDYDDEPQVTLMENDTGKTKVIVLGDVISQDDWLYQKSQSGGTRRPGVTTGRRGRDTSRHAPLSTQSQRASSPRASSPFVPQRNTHPITSPLRNARPIVDHSGNRRR